MYSVSHRNVADRSSELRPSELRPSELRSAGPADQAGLDNQVFQRLLDDRIVFLGSAIDDAVANRVCAQLLLLAAADRRHDISLYVNSPGGSVDAGMAIYDTMQFVENDVATYALGLAASMGQFLVCAGAAGKRFALPHARIMMHQPHGGLGGTASDVAIQAEQALYMKRTMAERIAFHTGRPVADVEADADRDRWFTAAEAKEYGIVDAVVSRAGRQPSGFATG
jgi:ATP-dependent Clp protease, protease subunit